MLRLAKVFIAALIAVAFGFTSVTQAADTDLSTWTVENSTVGAGIWNVAGDNLSVLQTINGNPTVFYSDFNAQGLAIEGDIVVETTGDDDFIGFVLGFQPGDLSNANADFLLVDWKQGNQPFAGCSVSGPGLAGLAVSRVTGVPTLAEFWKHIVEGCGTNGGLEELARGTTLFDTGWTDNVPATFKFEFTATNLKVFVNNVLEIDLDGVFNDGRIGFYNFSQPSVRYSSFQQDPIVDEGLTKEITSGPDVDSDGEIDIAIEVKQTTTTAYGFDLTYVPAESDPDHVVVFDRVPAEWDIGSIDGVDVSDTNNAPKGPADSGVGLGCGRSESGLGTDGNVDLTRGGKSGKSCSSSTEISWTLAPSEPSQTLNVGITTRQSPSGKTKFKPTSCGKLTINDGAQAYEADELGNLVLDNELNPIPVGEPSNSLMLVAVKDLNGGGIVGDGSGDEDGDGLSDANEAFDVGTNPCLADTDGDSVSDGADSCPLQGLPDLNAGETLGVDGCIVLPS